ncbi:MAG: hypothetical protein KUL79_15495 [Thauera sp.]|nr:hypothetical protein [Thauera sp.]
MHDGIVANMNATLITEFKHVADDGSIIQMIVWRVPDAVPPTVHGFKYRLVYVVEGLRVVGFDNERGKGDHCHIDGEERSYAFSTVDQLIEDFITEVEKRRAP